MENTKITDDLIKLLRVFVDVPRGDHGDSYGLSDSVVRQEIAKIFDLDAMFFFMRTRANPEADKLIRGHEKELAKERGITHDDYSFWFDADLNEAYLSALNEFCVRTNIPHVQWPLIETQGVHNLERHVDHAFWPVIHVVRNVEEAHDFSSFINHDLGGDEVYKWLKVKQAPQNYQMGQISLLYRERVKPFVLESRMWCVKGSDLRNAVDFLCQFTYWHAFHDDRGYD